MHVAEQFTGKVSWCFDSTFWVGTVAGFKELVEGRCDDFPVEDAFYMVGNIESARERLNRFFLEEEKSKTKKGS
ncbi:MAG: hypothetical protein R2883_08035 [Caldisericia bacterium]